MAEAAVVFASAAYFGFATKATCPAVACSKPATPVISRSVDPEFEDPQSTDPGSIVAPSAAASCPSFMKVYCQHIPEAGRSASSVSQCLRGEVLKQGHP